MENLSKTVVDYPRDLFYELIAKNSPYAFYLFQWVPYQTEAKLRRLKMLHDVRTFDGREALGIWPNADSCGPFKDHEVEFIRISKTQHGFQWADSDSPPMDAVRFQSEVDRWTRECFGEATAIDTTKGNARFLEEALELVQSCDFTAEAAHRLVDYVFNRPVGEKSQELGGVLTTLASLANAHKMSMTACADDALANNWSKMESIRTRVKPTFTEDRNGSS